MLAISAWNTLVGIFAYTTMPLGVELHTWPVTACGGVAIADRASLDTAVVWPASASI